MTPGAGQLALAHVPAREVIASYEGNIPHKIFVNVCKWGHGDRSNDLPAGFQGSSLGNLGYEGKSLFWFYGGEVDPPWDALNLPVELDADGDGNREVVAFSVVVPPAFPVAILPTDRCPLSADGTDDDGDGLFGACDPEPGFTNTYVAGGSATFPAYQRDLLRLGLPWRTFKKEAGFSGASAGPRQGFLDSDSDGLVDGEDLCPSSPGTYEDLADRNLWAEDLIFASDPGLKNLGRHYRGNECDPYPVPVTSWINSGETTSDSNICSLLRWSRGGADVVTYRAGVSAGRSSNDPNRGAPDNRQFRLQSYRCACTRVLSVV